MWTWTITDGKFDYEKKSNEEIEINTQSIRTIRNICKNLQSDNTYEHPHLIKRDVIAQPNTLVSFMEGYGGALPLPSQLLGFSYPRMRYDDHYRVTFLAGGYTNMHVANPQFQLIWGDNVFYNSCIRQPERDYMYPWITLLDIRVSTPLTLYYSTLPMGDLNTWLLHWCAGQICSYQYGGVGMSRQKHSYVINYDLYEYCPHVKSALRIAQWCQRMYLRRKRRAIKNAQLIPTYSSDFNGQLLNIIYNYAAPRTHAYFPS